MSQHSLTSPFDLTHEYGDDYATWLIQKKADELVGHFGITEDDREDIQQDLALDLLERWPDFNPDQSSPKTFVARIVAHKVSTIIRHAMAEQRRFDHVAGGLEAGDEEGVTTCFRTHEPRRSDQEVFEMGEDVATVLQQLSSEMRQVCERLKSESLSAIAQDLGIPVTTLRYRVKKLAAVFEEAGLREYL